MLATDPGVDHRSGPRSIHSPDEPSRSPSCGPDANPVVMSEPNIPIPADRWEFRTDGLWAEQVCEKPHDHWSYGLEAFALEVDDPTELTSTGFGRRVPLGWELDFYATTPSRWLLTDAEPLEHSGAYTQRENCPGLLLDAAGAPRRTDPDNGGTGGAPSHSHPPESPRADRATVPPKRRSSTYPSPRGR